MVSGGVYRLWCSVVDSGMGYFRLWGLEERSLCRGKGG